VLDIMISIPGTPSNIRTILSCPILAANMRVVDPRESV
jgi:hypothetical protein